ncbi:MAG: hypothetical protein IRY90_03070, partial [Actinomadura rubrobrunea]|nr:hypothetical protein [Actinomadura rubrobrunea]
MRVSRLVLYAAAIVYLLGQAYDTYYHNKNVSFVPEPPSSLWRIHAGIYIGSAMAVVTGVLLWRLAQAKLAGVIVSVGGVTQLTGFFADMWAHAHGYSKPLWHDLIWYGFAIVVAGGVLVEV